MPGLMDATSGPPPRQVGAMGAAQAEMEPNAEGQAQGGGGMSGVKQASPEQQVVYNRFVATAMNLMYDEKMLPKLVKMLEGNGDPIEGLARATVLVTARIATMAEESGQKLDGEVLFNAGAEIFNQLADTAEAAKIHDFASDRDALEGAYFRALDQFRELMQGAGRIDQKTFQRDLKQLQAMNESGELEKSLRGFAENDPRAGGGEPEGKPKPGMKPETKPAMSADAPAMGG